MGRFSQRSPRRPSWPALAWLLVLVLAITGAVVLAEHSDSGKTDERTAAALPSGSGQALDQQLDPLWSQASAVDDQRAVASGTVITSTARGLRGLDPHSGEERWHYQRSNATMCDATVLDDVVVAIFRTTGRCNEAVALEGDTGVRRWYRNVGFSERLTMLGSGSAAMAATADGIAVLDAVGDSIRWRYNPPQGCDLSSVGIGNSGVVVLESCTTGTVWLAEFELYSGDQQWRVAPPAGEVTVVGADGVVSLLVGDQLMILSSRTGAVLSTLPTSPASAESPGPAAAGMTGQPGGRGVPLVYAAGMLYALDPNSGAVLWSAAATAAPASSDAGLVVPEQNGFVSRNPLTGDVLARSVTNVPGATGGLSRIEQAGAVLLAVSSENVAAYG